MEKVRSFISIDIEDPEIINKIVHIQREIEGLRVATVKYVEPENLHYTLWFLGEIPASLIEDVYRVMRDIKSKPFKLELRGVSAFPSISRPRVIWIGAGKGSDAMINIYRQLEGGLRGLGFKPDKRGFTPHLTIGRVKSISNAPLLHKKLMELSDVEIGEVLVDRIRLKKSTLTPKGPIYTTLKEVRFS